MERRKLLALGGGIALSGCLRAITGPEKRIDWIRLVNDRTETYRIDVVIEDDDEEVFTDDYQLGTDSESSTARIDTPLEGQGRYVIRFQAGGQWVHVDPHEYDDIDTDCIGVRFELHQQGNRGYEIRPGTEC